MSTDKLDSSHLARESKDKLITDERYGYLYETVNPEFSPVRNLGLAIVYVDVGKESPLHYHEKTEEVYYIIDGCGIMTIDNHEFNIGVGDTIAIPLRSRHKIKNTGSFPLKFISADSPPYDINDDIEI